MPTRYATTKHRIGHAYNPKSNTRNHFPGTNCTENAVSCIGFRDAEQERRPYPAAPSPSLRVLLLGA
eukprot:1363630-Rhodomonas_salina.2